MATSLINTGVQFPDSTVQTTAATGGVTSLNGQTGSIVNTDINAIGSWCMVIYAATGTNSLNTLLFLNNNTTIAGSSLRADVINDGFPDGSMIYRKNTTTSSTYNGGGTALSGTWRLMGKHCWFANSNVGDGNFNASWMHLLMVRIS